jgi:hypothetical protein
MNDPDELAKLQVEVDSLRRQLTEAQALSSKLHRQLWSLDKGEVARAIQAAAEREITYWVGKCYRQRLAINHIQRKGWFPPEYIIKEEDLFSPLGEEEATVLRAG